ncbi:MAG: bifunctional metallophosphatase/5'-nucleotidase [Clostridia bacterium]|nr:bifunctional metallophosphatase/5'-nucleotidase [Clostridia bacterium]
MKRVIAMMLVLITLLLSSFSLFSCEFIGNGSTGNGSSEDNNGDNGNTNNGNGNTNTGNGNNTGNGGSTENNGNKDENYVPDCASGDHLDEDNNDYCDLCEKYIIVVIDFYVLNDLHGKFCDTATQPGVDELGTYLKDREQIDDNVVILSSGDMWQGTAESNLTHGNLMTEWMNEMNFVSMTLGNHEFDWGEDDIRDNLEIAEFPFLAINIYDNDTNALVDYCTPSVMIERDGIKIGIIGAIGDCYSSISADMVEGVHFKVGSALTNLVKAESDKLRSEGADLIVYSIHDGYGSSKSSTTVATPSLLSGYYDSVLSSGYVDLVFEAHTHQYYTLVDSSNVYHLQAGGENYGLSHVEISVNAGNGNKRVNVAEIVRNVSYSSLQDDPATEALEDKYSDIIDYAYAPLGKVSKNYSDVEVEDMVAQLYLEKGLEKWGKEYNIVLGGGFLRTRSPYNLTAGTKTYADILSLLPFDNRLVLCSISGYNLKKRFVNSTNSDYHSAYSEYGSSIMNSISNNETYYVIVDTYTSLYSPNGLTVVDYYDNSTFARDLLAEALMEGRLEVKHDAYKLTSINDALAIGSTLGSNKATSDYYYIKGTLKENPNSTYGNVYIVDDKGNEIYIYGLYDSNGNRYDAMSNKPVKGDTVIVYSTIYKYVNGSELKIELKNAVLLEIE